jgi:hypothetical protein
MDNLLQCFDELPDYSRIRGTQLHEFPERVRCAFLRFSDSDVVSLDESVFTTGKRGRRSFEQESLSKYSAGKNAYEIVTIRIDLQL